MALQFISAAHQFSVTVADLGPSVLPFEDVVKSRVRLLSTDPLRWGTADAEIKVKSQ